MIKKLALGSVIGLLAATVSHPLVCTWISLKANDRAVIVGRTMEWSLSDAQHYWLALLLRNRAYVSPGHQMGAKGMGRTGRFSILS